MIAKRILKIIALALLIIVLIVGGYIVYLSVSYSRIPDHEKLNTVYIRSSQDTLSSTVPEGGYSTDSIRELKTGEGYSATSMNIGFGAYDRDFSFFMDKNKLKDGTETAGISSRATDKAAVKRNVEAAMKNVGELNPDILIFQEVDIDADRSRHINQEEMLSTLPFLKDDPANSVFATNMHTAYLFYPLAEPIGKISQSGLLTMSSYRIASAERRSLPVDDSFPEKFFDLDRCLSVARMPVQGQDGELVLINVHTSAYDEGGVIRKQQMEMLRDIAGDERAKGNWVIIGGDFNHALYGSESEFLGQMQIAPWVQAFDETMLADGFSLVKPENSDIVSTCRDTSMPYSEGINYEVILDGFIVSDNVSATSEIVDAGFEGSDHNPVSLRFTLRKH